MTKKVHVVEPLQFSIFPQFFFFFLYFMLILFIHYRDKYKYNISISIFFSLYTVSLLDYPWKDIFTSMPMWAITCSHFCENWGFYTLLTQLPSYMNGNCKNFTLKLLWMLIDHVYAIYTDVLKFDIGKGSLLSALPYLVMSIILQFSGFIVDWLREKEIFTTTQVCIYIDY